VSFGAAPTIVAGGTGVVSATASSSLAVSFSSTTPGVCTVSGSTVTGVIPGLCVIAADQAGDATYSTAPQAIQFITISKASQSVSFGTAPQIAVGRTGIVSASATSGLAVSFSSATPGVCSVSGSIVTIITAGTCIIAADQAGNSYYAAAPQVTQSFTVIIGKVDQSIQFGPIPIIAVGRTGTVSATTTSGLAASFSSTTPTVCTVSGSTVTGIMAGTCTIAANQAGDADYNAAAQVTQSISIDGIMPMVAAGSSHTVALRPDGTVMAWGQLLVDGTWTKRLSPMSVPGLTGVVAVAAGTVNTLALKADGTLVAWGANYNGQLGDGTTTDRSTPVAVPGLTGVNHPRGR